MKFLLDTHTFYTLIHLLEQNLSLMYVHPSACLMSNQIMDVDEIWYGKITMLVVSLKSNQKMR
jgi:hypothetical protein